MDITGGCLCRAVRYRISAPLIVTRVCWCRLCQYLGSGNATVNGNAMHRRFCPKCGTQVFSEAEARPHLVFVRAGTFDDREIARPSATIWTSQAPSWACIDSALPTALAQPPPVS